MKVLDTTFLIDLLNGDPKTLKVLDSNEQMLTTQINMYELLRGIFLVGNSKSEVLKAIEMLGSMGVLKLDDNAIIRSAEIFADLTRRGQMIPDNDCITAGVALGRGITRIVTKNADHFKRIRGIEVETY